MRIGFGMLLHSLTGKGYKTIALVDPFVAGSTKAPYLFLERVGRAALLQKTTVLAPMYWIRIKSNIGTYVTTPVTGPGSYSEL